MQTRRGMNLAVRVRRALLVEQARGALGQRRFAIIRCLERLGAAQQYID
jgi:hypothetical protein